MSISGPANRLSAGPPHDTFDSWQARIERLVHQTEENIAFLQHQEERTASPRGASSSSRNISRVSVGCQLKPSYRGLSQSSRRRLQKNNFFSRSSTSLTSGAREAATPVTASSVGTGLYSATLPSYSAPTSPGRLYPSTSANKNFESALHHSRTYSMPPASLSHPVSPRHGVDTHTRSQSNLDTSTSNTSPRFRGCASLSQSHSSSAALLGSSRRAHNSCKMKSLPEDLADPGFTTTHSTRTRARVSTSPPKPASDYTRVLEERLDLLRSSFNFFKESICSQVVDSTRQVRDELVDRIDSMNAQIEQIEERQLVSSPEACARRGSTSSSLSASVHSAFTGDDVEREVMASDIVCLRETVDRISERLTEVSLATDKSCDKCSELDTLVTSRLASVSREHARNEQSVASLERKVQVQASALEDHNRSLTSKLEDALRDVKLLKDADRDRAKERMDLESRFVKLESGLHTTLQTTVSSNVKASVSDALKSTVLPGIEEQVKGVEGRQNQALAAIEADMETLKTTVSHNNAANSKLLEDQKAESSKQLAMLGCQLSSLFGEIASLKEAQKSPRISLFESDADGEASSSEQLTQEERLTKALKRIEESNAPPPVELVSSIFQKALENAESVSRLGASMEVLEANLEATAEVRSDNVSFGPDEQKAFLDLRDMVVSLRSELQELKADTAKSGETVSVVDRLDKFEGALGQISSRLDVASGDAALRLEAMEAAHSDTERSEKAAADLVSDLRADLTALQSDFTASVERAVDAKVAGIRAKLKDDLDLVNTVMHEEINTVKRDTRDMMSATEAAFKEDIEVVALREQVRDLSAKLSDLTQRHDVLLKQHEDNRRAHDEEMQSLIERLVDARVKAALSERISERRKVNTESSRMSGAASADDTNDSGEQAVRVETTSDAEQQPPQVQPPPELQQEPPPDAEQLPSSSRRSSLAMIETAIRRNSHSHSPPPPIPATVPSGGASRESSIASAADDHGYQAREVGAGKSVIEDAGGKQVPSPTSVIEEAGGKSRLRMLRTEDAGEKSKQEPAPSTEDSGRALDASAVSCLSVAIDPDNTSISREPDDVSSNNGEVDDVLSNESSTSRSMPPLSVDIPEDSGSLSSPMRTFDADVDKESPSPENEISPRSRHTASEAVTDELLADVMREAIENAGPAHTHSRNVDITSSGDSPGSAAEDAETPVASNEPAESEAPDGFMVANSSNCASNSEVDNVEESAGLALDSPTLKSYADDSRDSSNLALGDFASDAPANVNEVEDGDLGNSLDVADGDQGEALDDPANIGKAAGDDQGEVVGDADSVGKAAEGDQSDAADDADSVGDASDISEFDFDSDGSLELPNLDDRFDGSRSQGAGGAKPTADDSVARSQGAGEMMPTADASTLKSVENDGVVNSSVDSSANPESVESKSVASIDTELQQSSGSPPGSSRPADLSGGEAESEQQMVPNPTANSDPAEDSSLIAKTSPRRTRVGFALERSTSHEADGFVYIDTKHRPAAGGDGEDNASAPPDPESPQPAPILKNADQPSAIDAEALAESDRNNPPPKPKTPPKRKPAAGASNFKYLKLDKSSLSFQRPSTDDTRPVLSPLQQRTTGVFSFGGGGGGGALKAAGPTSQTQVLSSGGGASNPAGPTSQTQVLSSGGGASNPAGPTSQTQVLSSGAGAGVSSSRSPEAASTLQKRLPRASLPPLHTSRRLSSERSHQPSESSFETSSTPKMSIVIPPESAASPDVEGSPAVSPLSSITSAESLSLSDDESDAFPGLTPQKSIASETSEVKPAADTFQASDAPQLDSSMISTESMSFSDDDSDGFLELSPQKSIPPEVTDEDGDEADESSVHETTALSTPPEESSTGKPVSLVSARDTSPESSPKPVEGSSSLQSAPSPAQSGTDYVDVETPSQSSADNSPSVGSEDPRRTSIDREGPFQLSSNAEDSFQPSSSSDDPLWPLSDSEDLLRPPSTGTGSPRRSSSDSEDPLRPSFGSQDPLRPSSTGTEGPRRRSEATVGVASSPSRSTEELSDASAAESDANASVNDDVAAVSDIESDVASLDFCDSDDDDYGDDDEDEEF